jgi:flagellar biosynthesis/type III secretory pathway protein FliH
MIETITDNSRIQGIRINYESLFSGQNRDFDSDEGNTSRSEEIYTAEQVKNLIGEHEKQLLEQMEAELESAKKEAYRKGFETGLNKAKSEMNSSIGSVLNALKSVDAHVDELMNQVKPHIATMVFELAEKILALPVKNEILNERVSNEIEQIINDLESNTRVTVDVAESDLKIVESRIEAMPDSDHIVLRASGELNPGEYRVDTNREQIVKQFRKNLQDFRESVNLAEITDTDTETEL